LLREDAKVGAFAAVSFEWEKEEMAAGKEEHLASLATLLRAPLDQQQAFFAFTQEKFPVICPSGKATADKMVAALSRELTTRPRFELLGANPS
jgi:hypothetical protein